MSVGTNKEIGPRVRALREARGWSQGRLAGLIPGVKQQSIDRLEQGRVARPRFLPELAALFGVSEQWLATGEGKRDAAVRHADIDPMLLRDVVAAVEETLATRDFHLDPGDKAKLIGALYELMLAEAKPTRETIARVTDNIVSYERLLIRGER